RHTSFSRDWSSDVCSSDLVNPFEVVPWRVITALGFCVIAITAIGGWGRLTAVMRSPRLLGWFAISSVLLYANWQFFVVGIVTGQIGRASCRGRVYRPTTDR